VSTRAPGGARGRAVNIGPKERRKRLVIGVVMLVAGFGGLGALIAVGAAPAWRLALFVPFWAAALGYFQSWEGT
jgi:hypothetical protein